MNPRYEPVFTTRWQPGDYPNHSLEACGREWENRTTSERKRKSQTRSYRRVRKRESCRQPTMSPPPAPCVGLITGTYCILDDFNKAQEHYHWMYIFFETRFCEIPPTAHFVAGTLHNRCSTLQCCRLVAGCIAILLQHCGNIAVEYCNGHVCAMFLRILCTHCRAILQWPRWCNVSGILRTHCRAILRIYYDTTHVERSCNVDLKIRCNIALVTYERRSCNDPQ